MTPPATPARNSNATRDIANVLHPYTDQRAHAVQGPVVITRGEGVRVWDDQGKEYIEAMAGLWCASLGFSNTRLAEAAYAQMKKLPFYHAFTAKSHEPMIDLSEMLIERAPCPMSKVFYANSGSEANDTAVKMIWYFNNATGRPQKKKIISRLKAYHGITAVAGSVTGLPVNHKLFDLPVSDRFIHISTPHHYHGALPGESEEDFATRLAKELEDTILREGPDTVAAFFAEPVMGAGGVIVPPATYWDKIQAVLRKYDILFVADEVICGFGRTGRMFGTETFNLKPDVMVVSKALSSSYLPISAIIANERFVAPIMDQSNTIGTFGHGFTAGGHPVAAAVALENVRIIEEEGLVANAVASGRRLLEGLHALAGHPLVGEVRGVGLIAAVELVTDKAAKKALEPAGTLGGLVNAGLQANGVISRAMGDAIAFCPPLIITESEVDDLLSRFALTLDTVAKQI